MGKGTFLSIAAVILMSLMNCTVDAQQHSKIPHVGILLPSAPSTAADTNLEAFLQGLQHLGYVDGRNIVLEYRWADNREDQYSPLIADLLRLKVDLIYTSSTPAVLVAKQATQTVPIVFPNLSDPIGVGAVDSLARPGGNATGLSSLASDLWPKRLELLKDAFPKISRVAMIWNSGNPGMKLRAQETLASARAFGVTVQDNGVRDIDGLESVFAILSKDRPHAVHSASSKTNLRFCSTGSLSGDVRR